MIEVPVINALLANSAVAALVSNRVYPIELPEQDAASGAPQFPAVTLQVATGHSRPTLDTTGMQEWRLQVDCWDDSQFYNAMRVRDAVIAALASQTINADDLCITLTFDGPNSIPPFAGSDELFRCSIDFTANFAFPATEV